jgi:uncharacterized protein YjiS (DUF1127 family)
MATIISHMPAARLAAPRLAKTTTKTTTNITTKNATTRQPRPPLLWLQRLFWRAELKALDAAQMRDCGLDPETVRREMTKPFWRA